MENISKKKKKLLATLNHLISRVFFLGLNFFNFLTGCDTQCSKNLNKVQLLGEVVLHGVSQKALNNERFFLNICFKRTEAHRATTCTHFCYCTIFPLLEHHALWVRLSKKFSSITNYFYQFNPLCVFFLLFWFVNLSFFNHHASNPLFCYILITLIYTNLFFSFSLSPLEQSSSFWF